MTILVHVVKIKWRAVCVERRTYGSEGDSLYWVSTLLTAELATWRNEGKVY